jgi:hypothetical protein
MAFQQCQLYFQELAADQDPQCERFRRWLEHLLRDKRVNKDDTARLYRRIRYYRERKGEAVEGVIRVVVRSRHLGRELTDNDLNEMERDMRRLKADNYLLTCRAHHITQMVRAYLQCRRQVGPYSIWGYELPPEMYGHYNAML